MERAARSVIGTPFLQSNEVPNHICNLHRIENPVDGILRYHLLLLIHLFIFHIPDIHHLILIEGLAYLP